MEKKLFKVKNLVLASMFVSLSIVLTVVSVTFFQLSRIGFGEIPVMLAGIIMGPVMGGMVGLVADIVRMFLFPNGPYLPLFTLSAFLWGFIPGLMGHKYLKERGSLSSTRLLIIIGLTRLLVSVCLNTIWLAILYKKAYSVLIYDRIILSMIHIPIEWYVIKVILKRTDKAIV